MPVDLLLLGCLSWNKIYLNYVLSNDLQLKHLNVWKCAIYFHQEIKAKIHLAICQLGFCESPYFAQILSMCSADLIWAWAWPMAHTTRKKCGEAEFFLLKASGANPQSDGIHLAKWWHFPWIWCWTYMNFTWRQRSFKWLLKILRPSSSKEIHMKKLPMPFVIWPSKMGTAEVTLKSSVPSRSWDTNVAREFSKSILPQFDSNVTFNFQPPAFGNAIWSNTQARD